MAKLKFYLIALFVITSTCHLFAQTWSTPERINPEGMQAPHPSLTTDSSGTVWCSWCAQDGNAYVSHYDGSWSDPDTIYGSGSIFFVGSCLSTDANGNVWLVGGDDGVGKWSCFFDGNSWSDIVWIPVFPSCNHDGLATGDGLGNVWFAWTTGYFGDLHEVAYNVYSNGQWGSPMRVTYSTEDDNTLLSVTTDRSGRVWLGWQGSHGTPDCTSINACFNDGSGWSDTMLIDTCVGCSYVDGPALAVDTAGQVWAGWCTGESSNNNIYASYYNGVVWSSPMHVGSEPGSAAWPYPAVTHDSLGGIWLTWMNPTHDISFSYWNGTNWSNSAPVDTHPAMDGTPVMTFDGERVWVAWCSFRDGYPCVYASYTYGVGVEEKPAAEPLLSAPGLRQNYPNPFSINTTISYQLPSDCHFSLKIYDITGTLVGTLVNQNQKAGRYLVNWNGKDNVGTQLPAGIYFLRLETSNKSITKKIVKLE
ncbi:MAG: T9SS type A sorting domain-containing protein [Anaerolineales bacterium]|nr:T9SS type A sorting domain-containing protein [Anaerolineales bacterium]